MPVMEWNDSLLLGVKKVVKHHRQLVALLNKAYREFEAGASSKKLVFALDQLKEHASHHFASEENLMEKGSYPGFAQHREEHQRFLLRITDMLYDFPQMHKDLSLEVLSFLEDWLIHHFLQTDVGYCRFFAAKNIPKKMVTKAINRHVRPHYIPFFCKIAHPPFFVWPASTPIAFCKFNNPQLL